MRVTRVALAVGIAMISSHLLASTADAQAGSRKAPVIHLSTALGGSVATNYVEPWIRLGEDAYVFVISVDLDRIVQVLHPHDLDISVKLASDRELHLPRFFAGFADDRFVSRAGYAYSAFEPFGSGYTDTRGTLIALASRKPFNLAAISVGGEWDLDALGQLVNGRDPYAAAAALARHLGARGEPIGRDVHRFAGGRHFYNTSYASRSYYDCAGYYGALGYTRALASGYLISYFRAAQLRDAGYDVRFLGVDACGQPQFFVSAPRVANPLPGRPPAAGAFPRSRIPVGVPRNPTSDPVSTGSTVLGSRPHAPDRSAGRDLPMSPPSRVAEPRGAPEKSRPQPATGTTSERPRVPVDRAEPRARPPERVATPVYVPDRVAPPRSSPPPPPPPPPPAQVERERERPAPPPTPKPVAR